MSATLNFTALRLENITSIDQCTLSTCPLSIARVHYVPSLAGNTIFVVLFALLLAIQIVLGIMFRTWSYLIAMMFGLGLEIAGYIGRIQMHHNPFKLNPFLTYIICLTIGPVFFSAALYLLLSRLIVHYGLHHSRFSPKAITLFFITCDFIALVLQAAGGSIADSAKTFSLRNRAVHIMVAGLAWQVLNILMFSALSAEISISIRRERRSRGDLRTKKRASERSLSAYIFVLILATLFILIRSCYRVAELSKGFHSHISSEQIPFMIFESCMVGLATILLTAFHPGSQGFLGENWKIPSWGKKRIPQDGDLNLA